MKVIVDSKKGLKTNLKVFVDKKTIEEKIDIRLHELSKTINIKGFRPGKVPVNVLKRQFGKAVYGEVLEKILRETSTKALEDKKIKPAGQPKIDLKTYGEGKDLNYTLEINELPSIKLQSLDSIKFNDYEIKIEENEIKKRVDDLAKNQNNFIDKAENQVAANGDLVAFDYNATIENKNFEGGEGKNTQIVIGKDLFIKGFDKQLIGVKKNQEKEVMVVLPDNYPKKEFSNKKANFKCKILSVKKSEPVKIDDQFAKNLGAKDLTNLKDLVKKQIQNQYKMNLDSISKESILDQISKLHNVEVPENNSVMLSSLAGSKLGIWVAHGEGRFLFEGEEEDYNITMKYLDDAYPINPNASEYNTAGICSDDGRHLAMMPHLERIIFPWQGAHYPADKKQDDVTPWFEAFVNARKWIEEK